MNPLRVSDNQRFLVRADGSPFFYLGDTAWELFHRLDRDEADLYLADRAGKGFNVVQAVALAELDGLHAPNPYGHTPLHDDDPARPNEDYFRHVDHVVARANALGIVVALLPTWGDKWNRKWGTGPVVFTPANARTYGEFLGRRYRDAQVIWVLGGDRPVDDEAQLAIVRAMAEGLDAGDGGRHLMTFHPPGGNSSSTFVHAEPWLDFHMTQSGHDRNRSPADMISRDYQRLPARPVLDGEPLYEDHPNGFNFERGWLDHHDVRRSLYWGLFAGGCGFTYGTHNTWQFWQEDRKPINHARTPWRRALGLPGSSQVQHARWLLESRPYLTRVPDGSLVKSNAGDGVDRIAATRDADGSYALVYLPSGQRVTVDATKIGPAGGKLDAWWYNPRTGHARSISRFDNAQPLTFMPDTYDPDGRDWVLVLDDGARGFPTPGTRA